MIDKASIEQDLDSIYEVRNNQNLEFKEMMAYLKLEAYKDRTSKKHSANEILNKNLEEFIREQKKTQREIENLKSQLSSDIEDLQNLMDKD